MTADRSILSSNFTPILGVALCLVPRQLLEFGAHKFTHQLNMKYPNLRERLANANGKAFALILPDMKFNALLNIESGLLKTAIITKQSPIAADVTIHGESKNFIALLEGDSDGDALFFSRDLRVEGDTEALLILRNALDNEQINLREIFFSIFGPLSGLFSRAATPIEKLGTRFIRDMNRIYKMAKND